MDISPLPYTATMTTTTPSPPSQNGHRHHPDSLASPRGADSNPTSGAPAQHQPPRSSSHTQHSHSHSHTPAPTFRAPAHKHAHHLHTIPPREKSTRTLIIDHLLWVHACTRFAQARAELAMTDRTGGPGAPNYAHRERPEQWEEDEEVPSEGEEDGGGGRALRDRSGVPGHVRGGEEETQFARQDLPFARRLRQRAESLEKVVTGMLEQPPRDIPFPEDEPIAPMSPPLQQPLAVPVPKHVPPNGVRLRLALTTIINDLFARQAPVHRHLDFQVASRRNSDSSSSQPTTHTLSSSPPTPPQAPLSLLPPSLVPLLSVSNAIVTPSPHSPSNLSYPIHQQHPPAIVPSPRVRDMYAAGAGPSTTVEPDPPPFLLCPRHLHRTCEICVGPGRAAGAPTCALGASIRADERAPAVQHHAGGISGFAEGTGIGSGLVRPGPCGTLLQRGIPPPLDEKDQLHLHLHLPMAGPARNTRLAELIPRFVRLSALVALELGREVGADAEDVGGPNNGGRAALAPTAQWYFLLAGLLTRAVLEGYLTAGWTGLAPLHILLGFGLGGGAPTCDGGVPAPLQLPTDDRYAEFEPDDMPDLPDAVDVLFPSRSPNSNAGAGREIGYEDDKGEGEVGRSGGGGSGGTVGGRAGGEADYAREMGQRLARFLDLPASVPDLATHLEHLTWQFPTEPVERAALRFYEALGRWRGKPELETYKKRSPALGRTPVPTTVLEGGIGSAANAAVRRAIGRYFVIPCAVVTASADSTTTTDVLVSADGGDRVVIGRKRAHSISEEVATAAAASNGGGGGGGDRWRERRGRV